MTVKLTVPIGWLSSLRQTGSAIPPHIGISVLALILAVSATIYSYTHGFIISYGDAESHLNIAKRVVDSLTPGLAQLGGIWLPLPHMLLAPFVYFDFLWKTGLAGSIVSGIAYVIAAVYIFKITKLITNTNATSWLAALIFMTNPNVLYLQSTPMTELPLIAFFSLSSFYFIRFVQEPHNFVSLILAAFYGFLATLSRYDGWFLVALEGACLAALYAPNIVRGFIAEQRAQKVRNAFRKQWQQMEGTLFLFGTLALFGVVLWILWDFLILGDPLFFTHSEFSAKSQQQGWLAKGQLPSYHNWLSSLAYYFTTAMSNGGVILFTLAIIGLALFLFQKKSKNRLLIALILLAPFIFYVLTLYVGQSIIFIPHLTPATFEWRLFNVRYGVVTVPAVATFFSYLFLRSRLSLKLLLIFLVLAQFGLYGIGYSNVISLEDGVRGLSSAKRPDAERWMAENYDGGLVLLDDFSRLMSIIRSGVPMRNVIYIGNKPYWEESLEAPEKYATWLVIQKNDVVWKTIYEPLAMQGRLYKYFTKVYTSPEILIFKKTTELTQTTDAQ